LKKVFFITTLLLIPNLSFTNNLLIKYKKGDIKLTENTNFTSNSNWQDLFLSGKNCFTVDGKGNIFISEQNKHCIYKFNKNGQFIKKFGRFGQAPGDLQYPGAICFLDNNYLAVCEYGLLKRISIFNTSGKFAKYLKLSNPNNNITAMGSSIIAKNYKSLQDKKIHVYFELIDSINKKVIPLFDYPFCYKRIAIKPKRGGTLSLKPPFREEYFLRSSSNKIFTGNTSKREINVYSEKGNLENKIKLNLSQKTIPNIVKKRFISEVLQGLKRSKIINVNSQTENYLEKQVEKSNLPYYQDIVIDKDGNILVIEYRTILETSNKLKFQVYDGDGNYLCSSAFVSDKLKNLNGYSFFQSQSLYFFEHSIYVFLENTDNEDDLYYEVVKLDIVD